MVQGLYLFQTQLVQWDLLAYFIDMPTYVQGSGFKGSGFNWSLAAHQAPP